MRLFVPLPVSLKDPCMINTLTHRLGEYSAVAADLGVDAVALVPGPNFTRVVNRAFMSHERPFLIVVPATGPATALVPNLELRSWELVGFEDQVFDWRDQDGYTDAFADLDLEDIERAHSWINRDGAPRDECFMSTRKDSYTYGRGIGERTYFPIAYSAFIGMIRVKIKDLTGINYEACFSNKYVDEKKHLGWHADDSPSIDHTVGITVVSFGAVREIWFREFGTKGVEGIEKIALPHGSVLVMPAGFQSTHQHRIPKHGAKSDMRISLTFRKLK
jgi:hypothetical protein